MKPSMGVHSGILAAVLALMLVWAAGCHSYHIDMTVENRTGGAIHCWRWIIRAPALEPTTGGGRGLPVQHPGARQRPLKVVYTGSDGRQAQMDGPTLAERQEGRIQIVLLPGGKAEFIPN